MSSATGTHQDFTLHDGWTKGRIVKSYSEALNSHRGWLFKIQATRDGDTSGTADWEIDLDPDHVPVSVPGHLGGGDLTKINARLTMVPVVLDEGDLSEIQNAFNAGHSEVGLLCRHVYPSNLPANPTTSLTLRHHPGRRTYELRPNTYEHLCETTLLIGGTWGSKKTTKISDRILVERIPDTEFVEGPIAGSSSAVQG